MIMASVPSTWGTPPVTGELFVPMTGSNWPTIVVAYGTLAMTPPFDKLIRDFCDELVANGYVAIIPDYLAATGTAPTFDAVYSPNGAPKHADRWVSILRDAQSYAQNLSNVAKGRMGIVGFSLGGHLALRAAAGSTVKCVVDFFGPLAIGGSNVDEALAKSLPPVQIHHGESDNLVPIKNSKMLDQWLTTNGKKPEFHSYSANGHPGEDLLHPPGIGWTAQASATSRTITFLKNKV
jgi:dienelactone hydrolase